MRLRFPLLLVLGWFVLFLCFSDKAKPGQGFLGVAAAEWAALMPFVMLSLCGGVAYALYVVLFDWPDDVFGSGSGNGSTAGGEADWGGDCGD